MLKIEYFKLRLHYLFSCASSIRILCIIKIEIETFLRCLANRFSQYHRHRIHRFHDLEFRKHLICCIVFNMS